MNVNKIEGIKIESIATATPSIKGEGKNLANLSFLNQTASDLGFTAARELLLRNCIAKEQIGILLFVSTTPDYRSPATACVLQSRLGLSPSCCAFDINQGNTGLIHGLITCASMLKNSDASYGLLLLGDTRSKQNSNSEFLLRGDSGAVILLKKDSMADPIHTYIQTFSGDLKTIINTSGGFRTDLSCEDPNYLISITSDLGQLTIDEQKYLSCINQFLLKDISKFIKEVDSGLDTPKYLVLQSSDENLMRNFVSRSNHLKDDNILKLTKTYGNSGAAYPLLHLSTNKERMKPNTKTQVMFGLLGEGLTGAGISVHIDSSAIIENITTDSHYTEGKVSHNLEA
jgi:3-oxoacyl-[acyl-carrier-protein] synthase III